MLPKFCLNSPRKDFKVVIVDFLNVYMRFLQGKYECMNEVTFTQFIDTIAKSFDGKKIFFVKKVIWELPEEFHKKVLLKNKDSELFFVTVSNENNDIKYKERDDFVCYSLLNTIPDSIVLSNDTKILDQKLIGDTGIKIDILTLHTVPLDMQKSIESSCQYKSRGDYKRVKSFRFNRVQKN